MHLSIPILWWKPSTPGYTSKLIHIHSPIEKFLTGGCVRIQDIPSNTLLVGTNIWLAASAIPAERNLGFLFRARKYFPSSKLDRVLFSHMKAAFLTITYHLDAAKKNAINLRSFKQMSFLYLPKFLRDQKEVLPLWALLMFSYRLWGQLPASRP